MTHKKGDPPPLGTPEHAEWVRKKIRETADEYFEHQPDFDDRGILSGGERAMKSSDQEEFPDEPEERAPSTASNPKIKKEP